MIIDDRYKLLFADKSTISSVLYTSDKSMCENLPVHGHYETMKKYFAGDENGNFERFCEYVDKEAADYNPTVIKDKLTGEYLSPIITGSHEPYIYKYLEQLRFSFYRHTTPRSYKNTEIAYMENFDIVNEEGESVPQSFFLEEKRDNSSEMLKEYRKKLPYLLINIHNKGKCFGISTLSCIRAAMLDNTVRAFNFSNMKKYGILQMSRATGKCTRLLTANNGDFQRYFNGWLKGRYKDIAYKDLLEFIRICLEINVDLKNLDPREYDQDYIDSIECDYFTPNDEIVARNIEAAADKKSEYGNKSLEYEDSTYIVPYIEDKLIKNEKDEVLITTETVMNSFIGSYSVFNRSVFEILKQAKITDGGEYFDENGFLTDSTGNIKLLVPDALKDENIFDKKAVYHKSGYMILISQSTDSLTYLPPKLTAEYSSVLNDGADLGLISFTYNGTKRKWGEWITCFI